MDEILIENNFKRMFYIETCIDRSSRPIKSLYSIQLFRKLQTQFGRTSGLYLLHVIDYCRDKYYENTYYLNIVSKLAFDLIKEGFVLDTYPYAMFL